MEPIKYFEAPEIMEPHCPGCKHIVHYDRDTTFDNKKQVLICRFCGSAL